jgi:sulfopyruvate decarboxylase TPP-binding subunit
MKIRIIIDDVLNNNGIPDYKSLSEEELLSAIKEKYKCSKYISEQVIKKLW